MVAQRMQQPEERTLVIGPDIDAADHRKPAERRHVADEIVDVREVLAVGIERGQIPMHPLLVQRRTLERANAAEGVEIRLDAEVEVQILTGKACDAGAQGPAEDLRRRVGMRFVQRLPFFTHLVFDRKIHIAPAVMDAQLQRFALELDRAVIPACEFKDVRDPVDRAECALKMHLDHVAVRLVMDLVIDLVRKPEQLEELCRVVFHGNVFHRIGYPSGMREILACVDEILLKGKPLICHARAPTLN